MGKITIWKLETSDTTPRGFGYDPTYHLEEPTSGDMRWITPIEATLPDGYSIAESASGPKELYDTQGEYVKIVDDHGHPAILIDVRQNKRGKQYGVYNRLDKIAGSWYQIDRYGHGDITDMQYQMIQSTSCKKALIDYLTGRGWVIDDADAPITISRERIRGIMTTVARCQNETANYWTAIKVTE